MKITTLILALLILTTRLYAQDCDPFMAKGDHHYKRFQNVEALCNYERAYNICPDNYEALFKLMRAYNDVGEDLDPQCSEEYFIKAAQYGEILREKYHTESEVYLYLAAAYGNLALLRGGKEKIKLAGIVKENAEKSVELDPESYRPHIILGIYCRELANLNWCLKVFARAFFGEIPKVTNRDSEKELLRAIELDRTNIRAHYELAITYREMDRISEAVIYLRKAIELPPADHQDKRIKSKSEAMLMGLLE